MPAQKSTTLSTCCSWSNCKLYDCQPLMRAVLSYMQRCSVCVMYRSLVTIMCRGCLNSDCCEHHSEHHYVSAYVFHRRKKLEKELLKTLKRGKFEKKIKTGLLTDRLTPSATNRLLIMYAILLQHLFFFVTAVVYSHL